MRTVLLNNCEVQRIVSLESVLPLNALQSLPDDVYIWFGFSAIWHKKCSSYELMTFSNDLLSSEGAGLVEEFLVSREYGEETAANIIDMYHKADHKLFLGSLILLNNEELIRVIEETEELIVEHFNKIKNAEVPKDIEAEKYASREDIQSALRSVLCGKFNVVQHAEDFESL